MMHGRKNIKLHVTIIYIFAHDILQLCLLVSWVINNTFQKIYDAILHQSPAPSAQSRNGRYTSAHQGCGLLYIVSAISVLSYYS